MVKDIILFNILAGILLIPVNMLLAFGPGSMGYVMIIIGTIALGLLFLMRQTRGLMIGASVIATNPFQFFIYLCTIEILPVLVLVKLLLTN